MSEAAEAAEAANPNLAAGTPQSGDATPGTQEMLSQVIELQETASPDPQGADSDAVSGQKPVSPPPPEDQPLLSNGQGGSSAGSSGSDTETGVELVTSTGPDEKEEHKNGPLELADPPTIETQASNPERPAEFIRVGTQSTIPGVGEKKDNGKGMSGTAPQGEAGNGRLEGQKSAEAEVEDDTMMGTVKKYSNFECISFLIFMVVFMVMSGYTRGNVDLNYTQTLAIRQRLVETDMFNPAVGTGEKTFLDLNSVGDLWNYMQELLIPTLIVETDVNGQYINASNERYYPLTQARLMGGVRIRQRRNKKTKCDKGDNDKGFQSKFPTCYDLSKEDRGILKRGDSRYKFRSGDSLDDQTWRGKFGTYGGGGYVVDLPLDANLSHAIVAQLQSEDWIDGATRIVFIDFNLFNPTNYLHTVARLAVEFSAGGVFPNYEIKTWKFLRYAGDTGPIVATFQILFVLFIAAFTAIMIYEMRMDGCGWNTGYFGKTKWRVYDVLNMIVFYVSIIVFASNATAIRDYSLLDIKRYHSLRALQYSFLSEVYLLAVNSFISFFKLFKYVSVNRRARFFFTMMKRAGQDIFMFMVVLAVFFCAFGVFGYYAFSSDVDDFRSLVFSFANMCRFVVTDPPYDQLANSSRIWGSVYYVCWALLMLLVLANVFIAILAEAYAEVQNELKGDESSIGFFGFGAKMRSAFQNVKKTLGIVPQHSDLDADGDGQVTAVEIAEMLGWTEEAARDFIAEHDMDADGQLSIEEWRRLEEEARERAQAQAQGLLGNSASPRLTQRGSLGPRASLGIPSPRAGISMAQYRELSGRLDHITELLRATLDQTKSGNRALRQLEEKERGVRRKKSTATTPVGQPRFDDKQSQSSLRRRKG